MIWLLLVAFLLVGCGGGGGNDAPPLITETPGPTDPILPTPPTPAGLIYITLTVFDPTDRPGALIRSQTDGSRQVLLSDVPGGSVDMQVRVVGTTVEYRIDDDIWHVQTDGTGAHIVAAGEEFKQDPLPDLSPVPPIVFGTDYINVRARVGDRWIYERCPLLPDQVTAGQCDLYSVKTDGSATVALGTTPQYEAYQGMSGDLAVIRRVEGVTDTLYSIPITGGAETFITTLGATREVFEYVWGFVGDRIIIGEYGGYTGPFSSIRPNGQDLVLLADNVVHSDNFGGQTGLFVCYTGPRYALWCVPADGSAEPTKVTDHGKFVAGLTP